MTIEKPIVFFDLETTGVSISTDRIIQIACVKVNPDFTTEEKTTLINPQIHIPASATAVHGITDEMVEKAPLFKQIAKSLFSFFEGCDVGGYNSDYFDVPLLIEEFKRAGIEFPTWDLCFVDVLKYERIVNSHKLDETYKRYTGKELENAHDALSDVRATIEVLKFQTAKGENENITMQQIDEICQGDKKRVDFAGRLYEVDGIIYWNFGKHVDKPIINDISYCGGCLTPTFRKTQKTKSVSI